MSVFSLLGYLASFVLGCVVVYVFKPFLGSYSAKKGENLATKEDIAQITKVQEEIKAQISDDVWDRQRQWEMRRDAVIEAVRALSELEMALIELRIAHSMPLPETEDLRISTLAARHNRQGRFDACMTKYYCAQFVTDLVAGEELQRQLSEYFQEVGSAAIKNLNGDTVLLATPETWKELARKCKATIEAARRELRAGGTS
jgi:hypothetical protein